MDGSTKSVVEKNAKAPTDVENPKSFAARSTSEKRRPKRMDPALRVLTGRSKIQGCVSQLNTPAADFTPFHSPADPSKLNSDGPNWHLFNEKVTDSLQKLTQLKLQEGKISHAAEEMNKKLDLNNDEQ